jgi:hypothetical protein
MQDQISSPYPITPIAYFKRYIRNIDSHNETQEKCHLIYAALELRFTIEALLFSYLHALNGGELTKSQQNLYRPKDLKKAILSVDPLFLVKLEFADMASFMNRLTSSQLRPDIDLLSLVHGKLGDWLHAEYSAVVRRVPEERWIQLSDLFDSLNKHLSLILSYPLLQFNLSEEGEELMVRYARGELTKPEVEQRMNQRFGLIFKGTSHHFLLDE